MFIHMCKSKLAHGRITEAQLHYEGSITIDSKLLKAAAIFPFEKVDVLNVNNGNRFETYAIEGKAGSGQICLNGPAARLGVVGDEVIILSYALVESQKAGSLKPKIIHLNERNQIKRAQ